MPNDPMKVFSSIASKLSSPNVLVVHFWVPARNVNELIAIAIAKPDVLNYAATAIGPPTISNRGIIQGNG